MAPKCLCLWAAAGGPYAENPNKPANSQAFRVTRGFLRYIGGLAPRRNCGHPQKRQIIEGVIAGPGFPRPYSFSSSLPPGPPAFDS